jgi:Ricin-type beta-trefoil lectin domain-like
MAQQIEEIRNMASPLHIVSFQISLTKNRCQTIRPLMPPLITNYPLRIPEGIYLIRNAFSGRVLELENGAKSKGPVSVYTAPSRDGLDKSQIWSIMSIPHREHNYVIRNLAAGTVLDVTAHSSVDGTQISGFPWHGRTNQIWEFYGSRTAGG